MYIDGIRIREWITEIIAHPRAGGEISLTAKFIAKNINEAFELVKEYAVKIKERPEIKYTEIVAILLDDSDESMAEEYHYCDGGEDDKD